MNYEHERIAIEKWAFEKWALSSLASTVRIYPANALAANLVNPFVQIFIFNADSNQVELGGSSPVMFRVDGFVDFDINVDLYTATSLARQIVDTLSGIFLRQQISYGNSGNLIFRAGTRHNLGSGDGTYREAFRMPFHRNVRV